MTTPPPAVRRPLEAALLAAAFAAAHTQSPLFFSNQNQYLLHGLAAAGYGHLEHDWLANTRDPTPVFSVLVAGGYSAFGLGSLQVAFFALLAGYFLAARWLAAAVPGFADTRAARLGFAALFTAAHAAVLRWASVQAAGVDYPWYLQAGVAGQYLLGPGLQPSAFGVLLFAAVAAFAHGRAFTAALLVAGAAWLHSTYLLPGALLTAGMMTTLAANGRPRTAIGVGAVTLLAVLPAVLYAVGEFRPSSTDGFRDAQRILAEVRIPHHAVVGRWLGAVAWAQVGWVAVGLVLLRRANWVWALAVPAAAAVALTAVQAWTADPTFALLFPWRVSVVLVPAATVVVAARLTAALPDTRAVAWASGVVVVGLAAGGVWVTATARGYHANPAERGLLEWVRDTAGPGDVFLLPVRVPPVGTGPKGVVSTSFTPPPRPKPGSNLIPVDLQRFRLATGAAIYADFKSVPYADTEVLEWDRRMRLCQGWYDAAAWNSAARREELTREGVTHVVAPRGKEIAADWLEPVHEDAAYVVYRVR